MKAMPNCPPLDPVKVAALLAELRSGDLPNLVLALGHVRQAEHGFAAREVAKVEAFWSMVDMDYLAGGFVVRLKDGGRAYIAYSVDDQPPGHKEGVSVGRLGDGQRYPHLGPKDVGWSHDAEQLNEFLTRVWD